MSALCLSCLVHPTHSALHYPLGRANLAGAGDTTQSSAHASATAGNWTSIRRGLLNWCRVVGASEASHRRAIAGIFATSDGQGGDFVLSACVMVWIVAVAPFG